MRRRHTTQAPPVRSQAWSRRRRDKERHGDLDAIVTQTLAWEGALAQRDRV